MSLSLSGLSREFRNGSRRIRAIDNVNLELRRGDFAVVSGASGSGKSTLLLTMGGMLRPTTGTVRFEGESLYAGRRSDLKRFRKNHVGFVFQRFYLLEYLNVFDNIRLALTIRGKTASGEEIQAVAKEFGLSDRLSHRPSQLSIGERQRTAIARALVGEPSVILADEPTGNLDVENGEIIAEHLRKYSARGNIVVMVTHFPGQFEAGNRRIIVQSNAVTEQNDCLLKTVEISWRTPPV